MRILNVCDERLAELELRKRILAGRIATQRLELEAACEGLRRPFDTFDRAKAAGKRVLEHGPAIALVLAPLLFLMRRPLIGGVGLAASLAKKATRWWSLWKLGSKIFSAMPHPPKQRRYAA